MIGQYLSSVSRAHYRTQSRRRRHGNRDKSQHSDFIHLWTRFCMVCFLGEANDAGYGLLEQFDFVKDGMDYFPVFSAK
jgi:hypothetical protein